MALNLFKLLKTHSPPACCQRLSIGWNVYFYSCRQSNLVGLEVLYIHSVSENV